MNKINLEDLIKTFSYWGFINTADYFRSLKSDPENSDGWIDANVVKRHLIPDAGNSLTPQADYNFWREVGMVVRWKN